MPAALARFSFANAFLKNGFISPTRFVNSASIAIARALVGRSSSFAFPTGSVAFFFSSSRARASSRLIVLSLLPVPKAQLVPSAWQLRQQHELPYERVSLPPFPFGFASCSLAVARLLLEAVDSDRLLL